MAAPAFDDVFRDTRARVLGLAYQMTGDPAEAEDVVQETFLIVHRALASFRGEAAVATWVYRIALRVAARARKRRRSRGGSSLTREHEEDLAASPDPDRAAEKDEVARVRTALAELSPDHRAVISLFAVDGLAPAEIAAVLGIPEGTVWSRLRLARGRLREILARTAR